MGNQLNFQSFIKGHSFVIDDRLDINAFCLIV